MTVKLKQRDSENEQEDIYYKFLDAAR